MKQGWNPHKRMGTTEDVGGAVAAICSEDAAWITGQTIAADGGISLMSTEVPLLFQSRHNIFFNHSKYSL
jgi:enoyl-[acyl-carrier-protein] reductase (NADH)